MGGAVLGREVFEYPERQEVSDKQRDDYVCEG